MSLSALSCILKAVCAVSSSERLCSDYSPLPRIILFPLVLVSVSVTNAMTESNLGKTGLVSSNSLHREETSGQEFKVATWRQDPKPRPWRGVACRLTSHDELSLLPYRSQGRLLWRCKAHSGLGPCTSVINQENVPQASLMEVIPQLTFSLPRRNSSVCGADRCAHTCVRPHPLEFSRSPSPRFLCNRVSSSPGWL